jgi:hypothetical protein
MEYRKQTFGERSAVRAPDGQVPPELVQELDAAQKAYRRNPPVT